MRNLPIDRHSRPVTSRRSRTKTGKPITYHNFRRSWKAAPVRAKLPFTNPYKLRHLFGSTLARAEVSDTTLARLMRHTDPRTSKQQYIEPIDEDLREAAGRK